MKLKINFHKVKFEWDILLLQYVPNITPILLDDLTFAQITKDNTVIPIISNAGQLEADIDICPANSLLINLEATHTELLIPVTYTNQFRLFGTDLEWDIYFVVNGDTEEAPITYSNFIAYREPLTGLLYFYDNVSSAEGLNGEVTESFLWEFLSSSGQVLQPSITTRNGIVCVPQEFILKVTKTNAFNLTIVNSPCGCNSTIETDIETYSYEDIILKKNKDIPTCLAITIIKDEIVNCDNDCIQTVLSGQEAKASIYVDWNLDKWAVDEINRYILNNAVLTVKLYNYLGELMNSQTTTLATQLATTSYWDYIFTPPIIGDYIIEATLLVERCDNIPIVTLTGKTKIQATDILTLTKQGCDFYICNRSFDSYNITIARLEDIGRGRQVFTWVNKDWPQTLPMLKATKLLNFKEDGIYKIEIRRNTQIFIVVIPVFCKLQECISKYLLELLDSCSCGKPKVPTKEFNALTTLSTTLMAKYNYILKTNSELLSTNITLPIDTIVKVSDYLTLDILNVTTDEFIELVQLHQIIDRVNSYCISCKTNKNCCHG